jgi:hypothetical protein
MKLISVPHACLVSALIASGCNTVREPAVPEPALTNSVGRVAAGSGSPELYCATSTDNKGQITLRYELHNTRSETIYILNGRRMPYRLVRGPRTLVIFQGVNPPRPNTMYPITEIPVTRPLPPGAVFSGKVALPPRTIAHHYEWGPTPATLQHGPIQVHCEVAWGSTPITQNDQVSMAQLLAWQRIVAYGPIDVVLP